MSIGPLQKEKTKKPKAFNIYLLNSKVSLKELGCHTPTTTKIKRKGKVAGNEKRWGSMENTCSSSTSNIKCALISDEFNSHSDSFACYYLDLYYTSFTMHKMFSGQPAIMGFLSISLCLCHFVYIHICLYPILSLLSWPAKHALCSYFDSNPLLSNLVVQSIVFHFI